MAREGAGVRSGAQPGPNLTSRFGRAAEFDFSRPIRREQDLGRSLPSCLEPILATSLLSSGANKKTCVHTLMRRQRSTCVCLIAFKVSTWNAGDTKT